MARKEQRPANLTVGSGKQGVEAELKARPKQRGGTGAGSNLRGGERRPKRRGS